MAVYSKLFSFLYAYFPTIHFSPDFINVFQNQPLQMEDLIDSPLLRGLLPDWGRYPELRESLLKKILTSSKPFDIMESCISFQDKSFSKVLKVQFPEISVLSPVKRFVKQIEEDRLVYHTYDSKSKLYKWHISKTLVLHDQGNVYQIYQNYAFCYYRKCIIGYEIRNYNCLDKTGFPGISEYPFFINIRKRGWEDVYKGNEIADQKKAILYSVFKHTKDEEKKKNAKLCSICESWGNDFFRYLSKGYVKKLFIPKELQIAIKNNIRDLSEDTKKPTKVLKKPIEVFRDSFENAAYDDCMYVLEGTRKNFNQLIVDLFQIIKNISTRWRAHEILNRYNALGFSLPFSEKDSTFIRKIIKKLFAQKNNITDTDLKNALENYTEKYKRDITNKELFSLILKKYDKDKNMGITKSDYDRLFSMYNLILKSTDSMLESGHDIPEEERKNYVMDKHSYHKWHGGEVRTAEDEIWLTDFADILFSKIRENTPREFISLIEKFINSGPKDNKSNRSENKLIENFYNNRWKKYPSEFTDSTKRGMFFSLVGSYINSGREHLKKSELYQLYKESVSNPINHTKFRAIICDCIEKTRNEPAIRLLPK